MRYLRQHLWRREDLQPLSSAFPVRWHRLDSLPHPENGMSNYEVFNSVKSSTKCFHKPKDAREGGGEESKCPTCLLFRELWERKCLFDMKWLAYTLI